MPLARCYEPTPAGLAALEPRPMTPAQVADFVRRARQDTETFRTASGSLRSRAKPRSR